MGCFDLYGRFPQGKRHCTPFSGTPSTGKMLKWKWLANVARSVQSTFKQLILLPIKWWPETGSNRRRRPFQGRALPLSYLALALDLVASRAQTGRQEAGRSFVSTSPATGGAVRDPEDQSAAGRETTRHPNRSHAIENVEP